MDAVLQKKLALKVAIITIAVNFLLTCFKLVSGIVGHSGAMISDSVHSFSDVISTIIVIVGVVIGSKPYDTKHPYGHERLECVASIILAVLLFGTGALIGYNGINSLIFGIYKTITPPSTIALIGAIVSIAVKEGMFWYTIYYSKKINSLSLKADAWHHRSDALSSVGSLIAIVLTMTLKMPIFDVIASLIICVFIIKVAVQIFIEAVDKMVDKSLPQEKENEIKDLLLTIDGVLTVDEIKTRLFGNRIYVDIEIGADKDLSLQKAHAIAEKAHKTIEACDENIKHVMVHVNPVDKETMTEEKDL